MSAPEKERPILRPSFGWPNVLWPESSGPAIEDVWPSLYIGSDRVDEMARKVRELPWAKKTVELWQAEAESILEEEPSFVREEPGGRCGMIPSDEGQHLQFDPHRREPMYDPLTGRWREPDQNQRAAWVTLTHERIRRLMSTLGFLYHLTGDERYSRWVWEGLRRSVADLYAPERLPKQGAQGKDKRYSLVYGGLYEAQAQLQLVQALELVRDAPGGGDEDQKAVETTIFEAATDTLSRWMEVMLVHNMSCWADAALAVLGRWLGRRELIEQALYSERAGLRQLLKVGVPRDPKTGRTDGFWFETSSFYNFYALIPLIALYRVGEEEGAIDEDLRERFQSLFQAPLHLIDPQMRLLTLGDRVAVGGLSLTQIRHVYEYAAGQVDPELYGPVLAMLYEACGAERTCLAALAFGPDELPEPCKPPKTSAVLPAARMAAFRGTCDQGDLNLWFLGGEDNHSGQGHHHQDKLSISLHAFGDIISSDLGLPGFQDNDWALFLNGSFSHNTLLVNELSQGTMKCCRFEANVDADVSWAHAALVGSRDERRAGLWKTMVNRGDEVREGVYDDVTLERTVSFDPPFIVLLDRIEAPEDRRCSFVFHAYGSMLVATAEHGGSSLNLPPLPDSGSFGLFTERRSLDPAARVVADWRIRTGLWLRLVVASDGPFEATWGRTPANPRSETRGTVFLRAPGKVRRFGTALELHRGSPRLKDVKLRRDGTVETLLFDGARTSYAISH